jgi:hypothetical protein
VRRAGERHQGEQGQDKITHRHSPIVAGWAAGDKAGPAGCHFEQVICWFSPGGCSPAGKGFAV